MRARARQSSASRSADRRRPGRRARAASLLLLTERSEESEQQGYSAHTDADIGERLVIVRALLDGRDPGVDTRELLIESRTEVRVARILRRELHVAQILDVV